MRTFHANPNARYTPTINVNSLCALVDEETREAYAKRTDGVAPVIDVTKAGYFKVLGNGALPKQPVVVKARFFSAKAEAKIRAAGGHCLLVA